MTLLVSLQLLHASHVTKRVRLCLEASWLRESGMDVFLVVTEENSFHAAFVATLTGTGISSVNVLTHFEPNSVKILTFMFL